jgi:chromosome segregation ATPase
MNTSDITTTILRNLRDDIARIDARVTSHDARFGGVETRLGGIETRLGGIETRLGSVETRFGGVETRFGGVETRLGGVETRLGGVETQLGSVETQLGSVETQLDKLVVWTFELRGEMRGGFQRLDDRMDRLHSHLAETTARLTAQHDDLQATLHQMMAFMGQHGALASRIDACERDIIDLKERAF